MTATRIAVYYAPDVDDPLSAAGASWLGRDAQTGAPVPQPAVAGIEEITAEPRRYGFHATLKPPMRLREGVRSEAVAEAASDLARSIAPFELPPLAVADVHGFLALRETAPSPALQALADLCVAGLDGFRAEPDAAELARRRRAGLTAAEDALLRRWGYPWVFGAWFFHMTLTRRLTAPERAAFCPEIERHFGATPRAPRRVGAICLFSQPSAEQPFLLAERLTLRG